MPEGYALPDTAYLIRFPGMNNLELRATRFSLTIRDRHPGESDWQEVIGLNSLEEITVNGQPAALAHGGWNADIKAWDEAIDVWSLFWAHGEQVYILKTYGQSISVEDMIRIAESIP
jgi:predicted Zn-dependent protease